jgi:uracil-DNA glycosylase family 4
MNTVNSKSSGKFSIGCRQCARLAGFLDQIKAEYPDYFAKPVPSFGDSTARLLIVGLAPGLHGANRSGRPFTGDHAGILLYRTLHKFGFADRPESIHVHDGLRLLDCRITNAVKCLPPENKPTGAEVRQCNAYLGNVLAALPPGAAVLALGGIAHNAVLMACGEKGSDYKFGHAARHVLRSGLTLFDSYHCSRYNTQTRRLTEATFEQVFRAVQDFLQTPP